MNSRSRKPRVVITAGGRALRSISALTATVDPCSSRPTASAPTPARSSPRRSAACFLYQDQPVMPVAQAPELLLELMKREA